MDIVFPPLGAAPHDHGGPGHRVGPTEIGGYFHTFDLAAAPLAIVEAVLALAVRANRARIVDVVTQLAHVFDHHIHPVGVALAEVAARRILRAASAQTGDAGRNVLTTLAFLAKAIVLQL